MLDNIVPMMNDYYSDASERFCDLINKSDLTGLPISDYNKRYLNSLLLPSLRYYGDTCKSMGLITRISCRLYT